MHKKQLFLLVILMPFIGCRSQHNTAPKATALDSFFTDYIVTNRIEKIILSEQGNLFFKTGRVHGYLKHSQHPEQADIEFEPGALTDFSSYVVEHEDDIPDSVHPSPVFLNGVYLFSVPDTRRKRVAM